MPKSFLDSSYCRELVRTRADNELSQAYILDSLDISQWLRWKFIKSIAEQLSGDDREGEI